MCYRVAKLTWLVAWLPLVGCAARSNVYTQVSEAELPNISRLERSLPVLVDVEGRGDKRTVVLVTPPQALRLTDREKEILGESDEAGVDLFEFYVPGAGTHETVDRYASGVIVGSGGGGGRRVGAAGGEFKIVTGISAHDSGVSVGRGPATVPPGRGAPRKSVSGVGVNGEVTVGYDRANRVSAREKRRYYRP